MRVRSSVRRHPWIAAFAAGAVAAFGTFGFARGARLTVPYLVIVVVLGTLVAIADERARFSMPTLVGLAAWGTMHLAGGLVELSDDRILYNVTLGGWVRFDNLVHAIGFGSAGLAGFEMLRSSIRVELPRRTAWAVACTASLGAGALNEVVEFAATHLLAATEVGGYQNTGRDLVANLIGGVVAGTWAATRPAGAPPPG